MYVIIHMRYIAAKVSIRAARMVLHRVKTSERVGRMHIHLVWPFWNKESRAGNKPQNNKEHGKDRKY